MMSKPKNYPHAMTLRLSLPMHVEVENLAYDARISQAGFIRRCIHRGIAQAYERKSLPDLGRVGGGES